MRHFWDQLTKDQKRNVIAGLALVAGALLVQFAVVPWFEARQRVAGAIAGSEKTIRELASLGAEYGVLRQRSEEIKRVVERRPPGFALFSYLEKGAGDAGVKANIRSMNPLKSVPVEAYEETAVEMKLDKLTMKQLTDFLYLVESREDLVRIRKMTVGKMKESPEYLTAVFQVFTYQSLPPGSR
jgi:general secretion pathway protein M